MARNYLKMLPSVNVLNFASCHFLLMKIDSATQKFHLL